MSEIKLKPCPFCGGEAAAVFYVGYIYVSCENCGATSEMVKISEKYSVAEKAAAEAWNRRGDDATEAVREFAEKIKDLVKQKNYLLADIHNSKDFGMFTLGFEQVIDEILKEMEKE